MKKHYALGVDLGGTNIRLGLFDSKGICLAFKKVGHTGQATPAEMVLLIQQLVHDVLISAQMSITHIQGLGIGCPGPLNHENGFVYTMPNMRKFKNVPLKKLIEKELTIQTYIVNDANAAALGEYWRGAGIGAHSLMCVTLGTGVGSGIIIDGKIWHGMSDSGGEFGHVTIDPEGPLCGCGHHGCLETYTSATGIVRRTREALAQHRSSLICRLAHHDSSLITAKLVCDAAKQKDSFASQIMHETGVVLGMALANVVDILNPHMIVIGGGVANAGSLLFKPIRDTIKSHVFPSAYQCLRIKKAQLGDHAGIAGAAKVVFENAE